MDFIMKGSSDRRGADAPPAEFQSFQTFQQVVQIVRRLFWIPDVLITA